MKGVRKVKGESFKRGPGARKDSDTYPEGGPGSLMEGPKGFTDILRRPGRDKTKKEDIIAQSSRITCRNSRLGAAVVVDTLGYTCARPTRER